MMKNSKLLWPESKAVTSIEEQLVGRELREAVERGMRDRFPGPYGLEVGNPKDVPEGYEEKWLMNLHVIDTRGVEDRFGCIECRLKKGPRGLKKGFYLKYTVKYVDWDAASIVPVKVHIFDITDSWEKLETSTAVAKHQCQVLRLSLRVRLISRVSQREVICALVSLLCSRRPVISDYVIPLFWSTRGLVPAFR
ncbi:hypothetical protein BC332_11740 [Capsicum chinense]|nr:hypothetical protein BC332_11740 [Capsicum chinense]